MIEEINGVKFEIVRGDIGKQTDIDAVVNAANAYLMPGGGVAGVIHRGAGPRLAEECRPLAPIKPGQAVITGGYSLPNRYVIHCLGPVYGKDHPEAVLLANCYKNALQLADEKGIESIAFPALSTGAFSYPLREAAGVACRAIVDAIPLLQKVSVIRMVLWDRKALAVHEIALKKSVHTP